MKRRHARWIVLARAFGLLVGLGIGLLCTAAFHPAALKPQAQALLVERELQQTVGVGGAAAPAL